MDFSKYNQGNPFRVSSTAERDALLTEHRYDLNPDFAVVVTATSVIYCLNPDIKTWTARTSEPGEFPGFGTTSTTCTAGNDARIPGNGVLAPKLPPNFSSSADLALSTNNAASFPAITLPTLTASRNYNAVVDCRVTMWVDSDSTGQAVIRITANVCIVTDDSGVATCTISPTQTVNTDLVPSALSGATAALTTSAGGLTVTATRKSGSAMHASYDLVIQRFKDVGAASEVVLPTDIAGLVVWYKSGTLITTDAGILTAWGDSSGNGLDGTVVVDDGKTGPSYSGTGGAGLAGAKITISEGNPSALNMPAKCLSALTAIQTFAIMKRAADPAGTGAGGVGGLYTIGSASSGTVVPSVDGPPATIYDGMGSTTRPARGSSPGTMDEVCCYSAISTAAEWTNRLNGTELSTTATNTVGFDNSPRLWVAGDGPHSIFFVGEFYEFFAFDHKLSAEDLAKISAYVETGKQGQGGFGVAA